MTDKPKNVRKIRESMDAAEAGDPLRPEGGPGGTVGPGSSPGKQEKGAQQQAQSKPAPAAQPRDLDRGREVEDSVYDGRTLPDDSPVLPLGKTPTGDFAFLDAMRMLRVLEPRQFTKTTLPALFTPRIQYLEDTWPRWSKPDKDTGRSEIVGWDVTNCAETLMTACGRCGIWDPDDHVRGRGAHLGDDGTLIVHSGRQVNAGGTPMGPSVIGRQVYPAMPEWMAPAESGKDAPVHAQRILDLLSRWSWKRQADPLLLLGFMFAGLVGGALRVRPLVWITGERGTGKSTITEKEGVIHLFFDRRILTSSDATAAGIYRRLKHDTIPVMIDEIEARADNRKTKAVVELARQAYSGGDILRGSEGGESFTARCSLGFSSINIPPLRPQDLSRMAVLNLEALPQGASAPDLEAAQLPEAGRAILARWIERWHQWEPRLATWRAFLMSRRFDQRGAAQYGTLLAAADFMLHDEPPDSDSLEEIAGWMTPESVAEAADTYTDAENCIAYMASRVSPYIRSASQRTVGELLRQALGFVDHPEGEQDETDAVVGRRADVRVRKSAQRELERCGIKPLMIVGDKLMSFAAVPPRQADPKQALVAVATRGEGILKLFDGSDWQGEPGAYNPFTRALLRIEGAQMSPATGAPLRFADAVSRAVLVPAARLVSVEDAEDADAFG